MNLRMISGASIALITALAGCTTAETSDMADAPAVQSEAYADVADASGQTRAKARASQVGDSIRVNIEAAGMAQGIYAAHVHTIGRCDPPGFESAGGHWNPTTRQHGKDNPAGMHKGDLPNLMVGTDGRGTLEFTIPMAMIAEGATPLLDADGAAVMIHAKADDYRTDPTGNAGGRIACGVLG